MLLDDGEGNEVRTSNSARLGELQGEFRGPRSTTGSPFTGEAPVYTPFAHAAPLPSFKAALSGEETAVLLSIEVKAGAAGTAVDPFTEQETALRQPSEIAHDAAGAERAATVTAEKDIAGEEHSSPRYIASVLSLLSLPRFLSNCGTG